MDYGRPNPPQTIPILEDQMCIRPGIILCVWWWILRDRVLAGVCRQNNSWNRIFDAIFKHLLSTKSRNECIHIKFWKISWWNAKKIFSNLSLSTKSSWNRARSCLWHAMSVPLVRMQLRLLIWKRCGIVYGAVKYATVAYTVRFSRQKKEMSKRGNRSERNSYIFRPITGVGSTLRFRGLH